MQGNPFNSRKAILVVDDDTDAAELLENNLHAAGFNVTIAPDSAEALHRVARATPDLVILDLTLPDMDGIQVCRQIKENPSSKHVPVIVLTGKTTEVDRIVAFEFGVNDYITKPFNPRELILRVRNLLSLGEDPAKTEVFTIGDLSIDTARHLVKVRQKPITLTPTEFRLLLFLVENRSRVHTRDQLLQDVWKYENHVDSRTVDTHIRRLREKLGTVASYISTIRGVGYRFCGPG
jgi:DNA-binding response OmpR family regulator